MARGCRLSGFTFPEALVTIGLTVLFVGLIGGVFYEGRMLADQQDRHDRFVQDRLSVASYLPLFCERVRPPEWLGQDKVFVSEGGRLLAFYWDSDPKKALSIEVFRGAVQLVTPEGAWVWRTLEEPAVAWWKVDERVVGLNLQWSDHGRLRSLHIPWGSRVL